MQLGRNRYEFQLTAARRRLRVPSSAARHDATGFNSQPLEGSCRLPWLPGHPARGFNSQPLEGSCARRRHARTTTHSFNSQPLEGGCRPRKTFTPNPTCFNSQPSSLLIPNTKGIIFCPSVGKDHDRSCCRHECARPCRVFWCPILDVWRFLPRGR